MKRCWNGFAYFYIKDVNDYRTQIVIKKYAMMQVGIFSKIKLKGKEK